MMTSRASQEYSWDRESWDQETAKKLTHNHSHGYSLSIWDGVYCYSFPSSSFIYLSHIEEKYTETKKWEDLGLNG